MPHCHSASGSGSSKKKQSTQPPRLHLRDGAGVLSVEEGSGARRTATAAAVAGVWLTFTVPASADDAAAVEGTPDSSSRHDRLRCPVGEGDSGTLARLLVVVARTPEGQPERSAIWLECNLASVNPGYGTGSRGISKH